LPIPSEEWTFFVRQRHWRLTQRSVSHQDVAVLQAIVVLGLSAFVLINLA